MKKLEFATMVAIFVSASLFIMTKTQIEIVAICVGFIAMILNIAIMLANITSSHTGNQNEIKYDFSDASECFITETKKG